MIEWTKKDVFELLDIKNFDEYRGFIILYCDRYAVAKTFAKYPIHNRPSVYIVKSLMGKPYAKDLKIRSKGEEWYRIEAPLTLLTLAVNVQDPIFIQLEYMENDPLAKQHLKEIIDIFEDYTETDEYKKISEEKRGNGSNHTGEKRRLAVDLKDMEAVYPQLREEYESARQEYAFVKLHIENFILKNVLRIEELVRSNIQKKEIDWNSIDVVFRSILFGEKLGIFSLDNAYDNLLQIREMCYDQHFRQVTMNQCFSYKECEIQWGNQHNEEWRKKQDIRTLYFYERENVYYRDLFLTVLIREPARLNRFLSQWGSRIDYSIRFRDSLDSEFAKLKVELFCFTNNFDDKGDFAEKIENNCKAIKENISGYNQYIKLIQAQKIYLADLH
jgi:hypothetical protein